MTKFLQQTAGVRKVVTIVRSTFDFQYVKSELLQLANGIL
jgi:hypothetical protein